MSFDRDKLPRVKILTGLLVLFSVAGCGNKGGGGSSPDMGSPPPPSLAMSCKDALGDVYTLPAGLPAYDGTHRGDVIRCAPVGYLSAAQVTALLGKYAYKGAAAKSGFWMWKLAFRTERIPPDSAGAGAADPEGVSAAMLFVPDHPVANAPLVVYAHGTVGVADACAPSRYDLTMAPPMGTWDFPVNELALAGFGYSVIAPDYAGFGYGGAPGYFIAADEAHSVLDASRAAAHLLPASAKVASPLSIALVGHSQGGHAVLAAQAELGTYGAAGHVVGVAAFAPWWTSMAAWGAIFNPIAGFDTKNDSTPILFAMFYFYSAGELRDGPGGGVEMYQPADQALAKTTVLSPQCFDTTDLLKLGTTPSDFVLDSYVNDVGGSCAVSGMCTSTLSALWKTRWQDDRPPLDPNGPPLLIEYGGMDVYVTPGYAQCGRDKIAMDFGANPTATVTYCYDDGADHNDIVRRDSDYVNAWIAARAGVGSEPAACAPFPSGETCTPLPANL
jgi:hypothetical protein